MIPEFVGRIPVVVGLEALDEKSLEKILTKPKNAITKQYIQLFKMDGIELEFDKSAIKAVAKKAIPNCNIAYIDKEEMKTALSGYLNVLFEKDFIRT